MKTALTIIAQASLIILITIGLFAAAAITILTDQVTVYAIVYLIGTVPAIVLTIAIGRLR